MLGFGVWGGPLAWFIQLNANYALVSTPCFPGPERNLELPAHSAWTTPATFLVYIACVAVAVFAGLVSLKLLRRTRGENVESSASLQEAGHGRTRFLAFWGALLGFGFAAVIAVNLLALIMVPPCAL